MVAGIEANPTKLQRVAVPVGMDTVAGDQEEVGRTEKETMEIQV